MSDAFTVFNSKWNEEVVEYLTSKFNSVNPRFTVLSEIADNNAILAEIDNVSFIINSTGECLELSFATIDTEKMESVIQEILKWDVFVKHSPRFYVKVDKAIICQIFFVNGEHISPNEFKNIFYMFEPEVTLFENK